MRYRPDIDGLRGVAVLAVILFHVGAPASKGGFTGVDVFFVISGFLITSIISAEQRDGTFRFASFYARRVRRLLPALTATIVVVVACGWFLLLPHELASLGKSAAAAGAYASNILFWREAGYFGPEASDLPLLHTWSLAVEEQFYLVWPIALLVIHRLARARVALVLASVTIASLVISEWAVRTHPWAAFYLLPSRLWELALGGVLATAAGLRLRTTRTANVAAAFGLAAIVISHMWIRADAGFPGVRALLPCIGAALILARADDVEGWVCRGLSLPPVVALGKISYSLYLLHWPAIVLAELHHAGALSWRWRAAIVLSIVPLAFASWRWIEQPLRDKSRQWRGASVALMALVAVFVPVVLGALLWRSNGAPDRVPREVRQAAYRGLERNPLHETCNGLVTASRPVPRQSCLFGNKNPDQVDFVVWGDSHADHFVPGWAQLAAELGMTGRQLTRNGCPPLVDVDIEDEHGRVDSSCRKFAEAALAEIVDDEGLRLVVVAASWPNYGAATDQALAATLERLVAAGKRVVVLGNVPRFTVSPERCLPRALWHGRDLAVCDVPRSVVDRRSREAHEVLRELANPPHVEVWLPHEILCDAVSCRGHLEGVSLYLDKGHLNIEGSKALVQRLGGRELLGERR